MRPVAAVAFTLLKSTALVCGRRGAGSTNGNLRKIQMPQLYHNSDQEAQHLKAMETLATETGHEFAVVKQVYEQELARLQAEAHVTEFVLLLSSRRTREALRRPAKGGNSQPVAA
jgi:K+-sensing histidine kinase KdpD